MCIRDRSPSPPLGHTAGRSPPPPGPLLGPGPGGCGRRGPWRLSLIHIFQRVEDVRQNADDVIDVTGLGGEELPTDVAQPPVEDIADDEHQQCAGDAGTDIKQGARCV